VRRTGIAATTAAAMPSLRNVSRRETMGEISDFCMRTPKSIGM